MFSTIPLSHLMSGSDIEDKRNDAEGPVHTSQINLLLMPVMFVDAALTNFIRSVLFVGLKGRVLYTAKKVIQLKFQFDGAQFHDITSDDVMLADLRLYQRAQQRRRQRGRRRRHRVVTVRVSIHQIFSRNRRFPRAKLIDSR